MDYIKKEFKAGDILSALDLNNIGDGIEEAINLAQEGAAGAANMEKGSGEIATQQVPRADKVTQKEGEEALYFDFTGPADANMAGRIQYGAVGNYSASLNGRSAALNKHATAIGNSTVAKGEESFAQGYETVAEGGSSFAGGSKTYAKGEAAASLGSKTVAEGKYSFTTGVDTVAKYDYQTVVGSGNGGYDEEGNVIFDKESLFEVGNGGYDAEGNLIRSTAFKVMRDGRAKVTNGWVVDDNDVVVKSTMERSLGNFAEQLSIAIDPYLVVTSGRDDKNSVQAPTCSANGVYSAAFGHNATASNEYTSAIGKGVTASGIYSIAMGVGSQATNEADFAAGVNAVASGAHSRAFGTNVNAGYVYQTVIGKNNLNKEGTLFEIGNGADADNPGNAFEVYTEGDVAIRYNGQMYSLQKILEALNGFIDSAKI